VVVVVVRVGVVVVVRVGVVVRVVVRVRVRVTSEGEHADAAVLDLSFAQPFLERVRERG